MKQTNRIKRLFSLILTAAMLLGLMLPAHAATPETSALRFRQVDNSAVSAELRQDTADEIQDAPDYASTDLVRVSIVLDQKSTLEAGFSTADIAGNASAMSYRADLRDNQADVAARIAGVTKEPLDVVWNLTLAANIISANISYGQIQTIQNLPGVKDVVVETRYEPCVVDTQEAADPNMATSFLQIGSSHAWAAGYTGAGTRIAVIDTGIDTDHQSFAADAFAYSLSRQAELHEIPADEYTNRLNLLGPEEIAEKLGLLNISGANAQQLYVNSKIPFGYNYIDKDLDITHDHDTAGEHGSHVEGIAAANAFLSNADGSFSPALEAVKVQGVAPDAQIITMKVFGKGGGAYDSDYMAAIEDAIVLGCDSVNLSLGSGNPGFARNTTYQEILDGLADSDTMVVMSAGNSGHWAENSKVGTGYLYGDDVNFATSGSPGTYTNALNVASVDNIGFTGYYFSVAGNSVFYTDSSANGYSNAPFTTLAGEYDYVLIDGVGTEEELAALGDVVKGKIVLVSRGSTSFYQKHDAAAKAGALACIVYNNQPGTINMDLSSSSATIPCVSITQVDGAVIRTNSTPVFAEGSETVWYYTGKMQVATEVDSVVYDADYYTMSDFSSWGVPGTLGIKPEITAPGGSIYSVNGVVPGGEAYEVMSGTSMASPQVAGMAALMAQYIQEHHLDEKTGLSPRQLGQSLLMSTAVPVMEDFGDGDGYYPVLRQGAGLANIGNALAADTYLLMGQDATRSYADGKIKAELGDDPEKKGEYGFTFSVNNLSDRDQSYTMGGDFFTQDLFEDLGYTWLDTQTTALAAHVTFAVDGKEYKPVSKVDCDLDQDGDTDADDAQIILNYAVGAIDDIDPKADVNGDGSISTYDAYLLLSSLETEAFSVPAGQSAQVTVRIVLPETVKEQLDAQYVNGAYVEGYVYVTPLTNAEGAIAPEHSIPVLAFYGNWSDASMYDKGTYASRLYGDETPTYTGVTTTNFFTYTMEDGGSAHYQVGNPYGLEAKYPADRLAISGNAVLNRFQTSLIRNAAAIAAFIADDTGKVIEMSTVTNSLPSAYYYANGGTWQNTTAGLSWNKRLSSLGLTEGEQITVGLVAVPEYYETGGDITKAQLTELVESGKLGAGAFQAVTMTVDHTAPEILGVYKDLSNGDLIVTARDNQYMAVNAVMNASGTKRYGAKLPEQSEAGQTVTTRIPLDGANLGKKCLILVADYAGNEAVFEVENESGGEEHAGMMFGFTFLHYSGLTTDTRGSDQNRWMSIDPEKVYYYNDSDYGGTEDYSAINMQIVAAEYVDGYVYMATMDGDLYVAPHGEWENYELICNYFQYTDEDEIDDMAFNYADKKLYALDKHNNLYTIDLYSGQMEQIANITIVNPRSNAASYLKLTMLAIDNSGNFYAVNSGGTGYTFLYRFTRNEIVDGKIQDLTPVVNDANSRIGFYGTFGSLAWDHDKDVLYMIGSSSVLSSSASICITIDPQTGVGARTNTTEANGQDVTRYGSRVQNTIYGLYIVPSKASIIRPSSDATGITLDRTEVNGLIGTEFKLNEKVAPWNLSDPTVAWTTSNEAVATVDQNGTVTLVGSGEAVITATTNAKPHLTAACTVRATKLDPVSLSALVYDKDEHAYWADFQASNPAAWKAVSEKTTEFIGGALKGEYLYVHDGSNVFKVDADLFQTVENCGPVAAAWQWSDAAPAPAIGDLFDAIIGVCNEGFYLEMVYPEEGKLSYWDMSWDISSPMAAIAYAGSGTYDYVYYAKEYNDCPANFYYVISEDGTLWTVVILTFNNGESYVVDYDRLGTVPGIQLPVVSGITGGQYASMIYDQNTGYLMLSSYIEGEENHLYAIHPETLLATQLGSFGEKVWPVVSLHQYERITDLTVKLSRATADLYVGDTMHLTAKVIPAAYQNQVTWSTSDPGVATVDETGVVTAVAQGSAVITATSVDKDASGAAATAACEVTVQKLAEVDAEVQAQIVTAEGPKWVSIDTATMGVTVQGDAATVLTGAGAYDGKLYGTNSDFSSAGFLYQIDPANGFSETAGSNCSADYAIHDLTAAPAKTLEATSASGEPLTLDTFGTPIYLAHSQGLYMLLDYAAGTLTGWDLSEYYTDLAAIAYAGDTEYTDEDGVTRDAAAYYALGADGTLHTFAVYAEYDGSKEDPLFYQLDTGVVGNIGISFEDMTALSMTCVQDLLLISYSNPNGSAELYCVDPHAESLSAGKIGNIPGATAVTGLYTASEGSTAHPAPAFRMGGSAVSSNLVSLRTPHLAGQKAALVQAMPEAANVVGGSTASTGTVQITSRGETAADEKTVTVEVTAKDAGGNDIASTNGLITVGYNTDHLTLQSVAVHADCQAVLQSDGTVKFAYAGTQEIPAGTSVATLTFQVPSAVQTTVSIQTEQVNAQTPAYREALEVSYVHAHTELRNQKDATCTEAGYTGDTYCTDCGQLISQGESIPALGHKAQLRNAKEATCTEAGYTGNEVCTVCHEVLKQGEVIPAHCPSEDFSDLDSNLWYHPYTDYVITHGLMEGVGNGKFAPNENLTRGQLVTILHRLSGSPEPTGTNPFTDVKAGRYYTAAVTWAAEQGLAKGITPTQFAPDAPVTREQVVTFLYRYASLSGADVSATGSLSGFPDASSVSEYAQVPMAWAVETGLLLGMDGRLAPKGSTTRVQAAAFLMRLCEEILEEPLP